MKNAKEKTLTNGPYLPLWATYDALGRPSHMYQDTWGRPVTDGVKWLADWRAKGGV